VSAPDHHRDAEDGADDGASEAGAAPSIATGEALLQEALAKRAKGDAAGSQRLIDRARIVLERATAETAVFEPREGIWDVSAMAWSGDGGDLAVAAASGIYLFHGDGMDEALRLHADTQPVRGIAISADARMLVSAGVDQDPHVWDLVSGRRTRTLHRPEEMVGETLSSLSFSPDGTKVAGRAWANAWPTVWKLEAAGSSVPGTAYQDGNVASFRAATDNGIESDLLAFSPDGNSLVSAYERRLLFWDLRSNSTLVSRTVRVPEKHLAGDSLSAVTFHPNGRSLAASSESGKVLVWDALDRKSRAVQAAHAMVRIAFSRDGRKILSVSTDGDMRTFATNTLATVTAHKATMLADAVVAPSPDASSAAIAENGGLVVVDAGTGKAVERVRKPVPFSALAISHDARRVALGTATGSTVLLSLADGSFESLRGQAGEITALAFSSDGTRLATASRDGSVRMWDLAARNSLTLLSGPKAIHAVAFQPDGRVLAVAGDQLLTVVDTRSGQVLASLESGPCAVLSVAFSRDGAVLAANGSDDAVRRWNAQTYAPLPQTKSNLGCASEHLSPANTLAFTADDKTMVSAGHDSVDLWNGPTKTELRIPQGTHLRSLAVSPSEPMVVAAVGATVRRWRISDRMELPALAGHRDEPVDFVAFAPDGRSLFGVSRRGTLSIWSATDGTLQLTLFWRDEASALALTPNGRAERLAKNAPLSALALCRLGTRIYPAELCDASALSVGLVGKVLTRQYPRAGYLPHPE
jgi:WD40 repeat protein